MEVKKDKVQSTILLNTRQAVSELGKLEMEANEVKNAMEGMKEGSDEYVKASKQLQTAKKRIKELREELGLSGMTLGQLVKMQKDLSREIKFTATRGTTQYKKLKREYQEVTAEIRRQRQELRGGASWLDRFRNGLGKLGGLGVAIAGLSWTIDGLMQGISTAVQQIGDLSDHISDVQKTTGLTREEVDELTVSLDQLNTRTSREELLGLATIAGKLGVQGKQNIEGFVKAADKLVVALGEDLGGDAEQTIKQVGKLVDLFKVKEEFGLEEGLNKVGSTINSLGAASSASEAFLVDFTKRLGGIAPNANIAIADILGLAATLDQLGQTSEVSSTAMSQLLVALGQDMPAFAKIAGIEVAEFSELLEKDANGALIKVIEGAKSTRNGLAGMAETLNALGVDGSRAAAVVGVLSNNVDLLKEQQALANREFEAGTSILNEFNTKNENFAAKIEKLQKKLKAIFVNSTLMKGLEFFVDGLNELFKVTETTTQAISKETAEMNSLFAIIKDANVETTVRKQAIEKLNTAYGAYLPKLLTEKDALNEIEEAQAHANRALIQNIILKKEKEKVEQAVIKQLESQKSILSDLQKEQKELSLFEDLLNKKRTAFEADREAGKLSVLDITEGTREMDQLQANIDLAQARIAELNQASQIVASSASIDFIRMETDRMLKAFGLARKRIVKETTADLAIDTKSALPITSGDPSDEQKKIDAILKKWERFNQKMDEMRQEREIALLDEDVQEMARIDSKYNAMLQQAEELYLQEKALYTKSEADKERNRDKLAELDRRYTETAKGIWELFAMEQEEFQRQQHEKLVQEHQEYLKKIEQEEKEANARKLQEQKEVFDAQMGLLQAYSDLAGATNELVALQGEKGATFAKQLAVFQLALDTATAISSAIAGASAAAAAGGPAAPFLLGGYITSMVATVVAGVAKAKKLLAQEPPEAPKYAKGGYTVGYGQKDSTGYKPAGIVHEGEYVVPKWLLTQNSYVADQVAMIEALRLRRPNFATGGPVETAAPMAKPSMMQESQAMGQLLLEMQLIRENLDALQQKTLYAKFTKNALDEADDYRTQITRSEQKSAI